MTDSTPSPIGAGSVVGGYEVLSTLGSGGMGIVYLARQRTPNRLVALKALQSVRRSDPDAVRRFDREREVGSLAHPNIVTVYESFEHESVPLISMELVDAGSLRRYIGQMTFAEVVGVLEAVLAGLEHLARHGIVHRDIKPENIMVNAAGAVKITDFGIARVLGDASRTSTGNGPGTPGYMAPEQPISAEVGAWTDLYAVGLVAYELLAGRRPAPQERAPAALAALAQQHVAGGAWRPPRQRPATRFAEWLTRMLEPDPRRRYATADAAWADLEQCAREILPEGWRHRDPLARIARTAAPDGANEVGAESTHAKRAHRRGPWTAWRGLRSAITADPAVGSRAPVAALAITLALLGYLGSRLVVPADGLSVRPESTATLQLGLHAGWKRLPRTPGRPALGLRETMRVGPAVSGPALTAGMVDVDDPSLLPSGRVEAPVPQPDVVRLGAVRALRYRGAVVAGSEGRFTLYAVPTDEGVAMIACPAQPRAFAARCEQTAGTLELLDITAVDIGPADAYARALGSALGIVDRARRVEGRALARARTRTGQARAAADLADEHETAGLILDRLELRAADRTINRDLVAALRRLVTRYRALASAARQGGPRRYRAAARAIAKADAAIDGALRRLRAAGYTVRRR